MAKKRNPIAARHSVSSREMEYEKFGVQYLEQAIEECSEAPTRELFLFQAAHMVLPVMETGHREIRLPFKHLKPPP